MKGRLRYAELVPGDMLLYYRTRVLNACHAWLVVSVQRLPNGLTTVVYMEELDNPAVYDETRKIEACWHVVRPR